MFGLVRAGGRAAAVIMLTATIVGAGPSQAWALSNAASTPSTISAPVAAAPIVVAVEPLQIVLPVETVSVQPGPAATPTSDGTVIETVSPYIPIDVVADVAPAIIPTPVSAPVVTKRATLAQLVAAHRSSAIPDRERECLAGAIYFESKGEPLPGQVAVGQVIANRAKSGRFPTSYCGVVFQRSQFSFVRGRALPPIPRSSAHWKTAVAVAHIVANGLHDAVAPKSLFFHARYVSPNWKRMSKVATVGNHVFYR